jgi:branched-chain amino acid transport system permease protein
MDTTHPSYTVVRGTRGSMALFAFALLLVAFAASLPFWGESSWMREFV